MNQAGSNIALDLLMVAFTIAGLSYVLVLVVIPLWFRGRKVQAIDIVLLVVVSDILSEVLKLLFERPRPGESLASVHMLEWGPLASASGFSFPSGHALRTFAVGLYLAFVLEKPTLRLASLGFAGMVGVSRIYLGLHWPSDVLAGALIGLVLAAVLFLTRRREGRYARVTRRLVLWLDARFSSFRIRKSS